jgi:hypothetical protein
LFIWSWFGAIIAYLDEYTVIRPGLFCDLKLETLAEKFEDNRALTQFGGFSTT